MGQESGRLCLGELVALTEELHRHQNRFRNECCQLLQDILSELEPKEQPDSSVTSVQPTKDSASGHQELRHALDAHWQEVDSGVENLHSKACDSIYAFVTFAEARLAAYERQARHRAERARLAQFDPKDDNE
jgi:hypothetical protein